MKAKILLLAMSLALVAAACNKTSDQASQNNDQTGNTPAPSQAPAPAPSPTPAPTPAPTPVAKTYEVKMAGSAFDPASLTIKKGDTVKFVNTASKAIWPASAPHPTHTDYPEFDPKQGIAAGSSWSFVFTKTGTWKYHDHLNPAARGTITVE